MKYVSPGRVEIVDGFQEANWTADPAIRTRSDEYSCVECENNSTATANVLRDGWFYTGDLGLFDEQHFVFVVDRKKDMIISGGENIYSWEVEEALRSHAAVSEAAVIGVPDPRWGESVMAFIVARSSVTAEDLIAHCRTSIASYKKPRTIEFVEALPRSFNGKIDKKALRAPFWSKEARQV